MTGIYQWRSGLSDMMVSFLNEKRITGYKYAHQEKWLIRFDSYYDRNGYTGIRITKSMVDDFVYSSLEQPSTHYQKERLLRDFALFLIQHGHREVYVAQVKSAPVKKCSHIPYIFTKEEIRHFFTAIDAWEDSFYTNRHLVDPVLFRMLYGTGMRVSEALNITVKDFDRLNGVLSVYQAKNYKDRLIPVAPGLANRIGEFINTFHKYSKDTAFLFQSPGKGKMDKSTVYRHFRQYLQSANISHTDAGPRVHDFRHSYAVKCLKKWVLAGEELTSLLPYLAAYMGHSDFSTQYYLRLTADLYPDIIDRLETGFGYVIPEGGPTDEGNDFPKYLSDFLSKYLPGQRNASTHTIASYRDVFKLLLIFCDSAKSIKPEKIKASDLSKELILHFLDWLETERKCSISTRNQRLAVIHSFVHYVQKESPENLFEFKKILSIPNKKYPRTLVAYLTGQEVQILLSQPDTSMVEEFRNAILLSVLYDTGSRVQELINIRVKDVRLSSPAVVRLHGKGSKIRQVPLMSKTSENLSLYLEMKKHHSGISKGDNYLFVNQRKQQLSRWGVSYILNKYVKMAKDDVGFNVDFPVTPHVLRHSKAMHLLQSGVNLIYIRDFLGHVDCSTTEVYARADSEMKRKAIEKAYVNLVPETVPKWEEDGNLMAWLNSLCN